MEGFFSIVVKPEENLMELYLYEQHWWDGGGGVKASILLNEHQALSPAPTDTNSICVPERKGVCACVDDRQGDSNGCPSKTGRLHFHRCRFCELIGSEVGDRYQVTLS